MWPRQNDNTHLRARKTEFTTQKAKHVILEVSLHFGATRSIYIGVYEAHPIYGFFNRHWFTLEQLVDNASNALPPEFGTTATPPVLFEQVGYVWRRHKTLLFSNLLQTYTALLCISTAFVSPFWHSLYKAVFVPAFEAFFLIRSLFGVGAGLQLPTFFDRLRLL
jgi:hypothetical protein